MKPMLKPLGTKRLKLKFDILLSNFAFKFNLRRYTVVPRVEDAEMDVHAGSKRAAPTTPALQQTKKTRLDTSAWAVVVKLEKEEEEEEEEEE